MLIPILLFFIQTFLVYNDTTGYELKELTVLASKGREVWHKHNCQSCHQLYGFGGFLGSDLTNRGKDFSADILQSLLAVGPKGMPSTYLTKHEAFALSWYFLELNTTGKSQPIATHTVRLAELPWFTYIKFQSM